MKNRLLALAVAFVFVLSCLTLVSCSNNVIENFIKDSTTLSLQTNTVNSYNEEKQNSSSVVEHDIQVEETKNVINPEEYELVICEKANDSTEIYMESFFIKCNERYTEKHSTTELKKLINSDFDFCVIDASCTHRFLSYGKPLTTNVIDIYDLNGNFIKSFAKDQLVELEIGSYYGGIFDIGSSNESYFKIVQNKSPQKRYMSIDDALAIDLTIESANNTIIANKRFAGGFYYSNNDFRCIYNQCAITPHEEILKKEASSNIISTIVLGDRIVCHLGEYKRNTYQVDIYRADDYSRVPTSVRTSEELSKLDVGEYYIVIGYRYAGRLMDGYAESFSVDYFFKLIVQ